MTVVKRGKFFHYQGRRNMAREITLTRGQVTIVDDADFEWLSQWKWKALKRDGSDGYYAHRAQYLPGGKMLSLMMHRVIMGIQPQVRLQVDHIDLNTLNNRRGNLRIATPAQNKANSKCRRDNAVGLKGVRRVAEGCFVARITYGGKQEYLGCFATAEEAATVYAKAAVDYYGEFARWSDQ
jgi:hypothetical protein